jgi:hypothetical protein
MMFCNYSIQQTILYIYIYINKEVSSFVWFYLDFRWRSKENEREGGVIVIWERYDYLRFVRRGLILGFFFILISFI